ncbi:hypothetical protein HK24_10810 [Gluconobacter sp. DsW_058]|nr:hypothetical protein HK24_10810 [Gluconobacter sp. DsW_058]
MADAGHNGIISDTMGIKSAFLSANSIVLTLLLIQQRSRHHAGHRLSDAVSHRKSGIPSGHRSAEACSHGAGSSGGDQGCVGQSG